MIPFFPSSRSSYLIAAEGGGVAVLVAQWHRAARVGYPALRVEQIVDRQPQPRIFEEGQVAGDLWHLAEVGEEAQVEGRERVEGQIAVRAADDAAAAVIFGEIGRASCRERGCQYV